MAHAPSPAIAVESVLPPLSQREWRSMACLVAVAVDDRVPRHRVFLLSKCPRCGLQVRRRRFLVTRELPQTTTCTNTPPVAWNGGRCEMDLKPTACPYPVPARVLELQQRLCHVLKPGLNDEEFLGIVHQLVDLATIACSGVDPRRMGPKSWPNRRRWRRSW